MRSKYKIEVKCITEVCEIEQAPNWGYLSINRRKKKFNNYTNFLSGTQALGSFWDFGDGTHSYSKEPIHTFPRGGTYNVCLTAFGSSISGECCQMTRCTPIKIRGCLFDFLPIVDPDKDDAHDKESKNPLEL